MPHIFDNIENRLLDALRNDLREAKRADFCVGYFNLRGWRYLDALMDQWQGGAESCCRLLVGMTERPEDEMRKTLNLRGEQEINQATVTRLRQRMAQEFREQLLVGAPSNADQQGLRRLSEQWRSKRLVVKLFLRHKLHAKLYLLHLDDRRTPIVGYVGSSNLTMAGLKSEGELNVDVLDNDACEKLARWFNDRWSDRWCLDISQELADIIDESWAREEMPPPYYIYLKKRDIKALEGVSGDSEDPTALAWRFSPSSNEKRCRVKPEKAPEGVLLYMRTSEGNDALAWVNRKGEQVTQSQLAILRAAACTIDTRAIARPPEQHDLVAEGVKHILEEEITNSGGQLGGASDAIARWPLSTVRPLRVCLIACVQSNAVCYSVLFLSLRVTFVQLFRYIL